MASGRIRTRTATIVAVLCTAWTAGALPGAARAADPTPIACTRAALESAIATGGSYAFQGNCSLIIPVGTPRYVLPQGRSVTLDGGPYSVTIDGFFSSLQQSGDGFMVVAGALTLKHLQVIGFRVGGPAYAGANGTRGTNGTPGVDGATPGASGTAGGAGGNGTAGGNGRVAQGAALTITPTGNVTLDAVTMASNQANGGYAGEGGAGGDGGRGGNGAAGANAPNTGTGGGVGGPGGNGAAGGRGGAGGQPGRGADAFGGAIRNDGTLTITGSTFLSNLARGGQGGFVNDGGAGGYGGNGGAGGNGYYDNGGRGGNGAPAGAGGDGGPAGHSGDAKGGAIYNTGDLTIASTTFRYNAARGGNGQAGRGGGGGVGGAGGGGGTVGNQCGGICPPTTPNPARQPGASGAGAAGGNGGNAGAMNAGTSAIGGAVYSTQPYILTGGSTDTDVVAGGPSSGYVGGPGGDGTPPGTAGTPAFAPQTPGSQSAPDFFPAPSTCGGARRAATRVATTRALACKTIGVTVSRVLGTGWSQKSGKSYLGKGKSPPVGFTLSDHDGGFSRRCVSGCVNVRVAVTDPATKKPLPLANVRLSATVGGTPITPDSGNGVFCPTDLGSRLDKGCATTLTKTLDHKRDLDVYYWMPGVAKDTDIKITVQVDAPQRPGVTRTQTLVAKPNVAFSGSYKLSTTARRVLQYVVPAVTGLGALDLVDKCGLVVKAVSGVITPHMPQKMRTAAKHAISSLQKLAKKGCNLAKSVGIVTKLRATLGWIVFWTFENRLGVAPNGLVGQPRLISFVAQIAFEYSGFFDTFLNSIRAFTYADLDISSPDQPAARKGDTMKLKVYETSYRGESSIVSDVLGGVTDALWLKMYGTKSGKKIDPYEEYAVGGYWPGCWLDPAKNHDKWYAWVGSNPCKVGDF